MEPLHGRLSRRVAVVALLLGAIPGAARAALPVVTTTEGLASLAREARR